MTIPTKAEAQEILRPYEGQISKLILEAWDECLKIRAFRAREGWAPLLYSRTVSNDMFDAIARRAIPAFGREPRVSLKAESQTFKIFFGGRLVARFKKGGGDKLGRNIPTQSALAFMDADGQVAGFPSETAKVEIIWLPNELKTKIDRILVVARDGRSLIWEYEVDRGDAAEKPVPFPSPVAPPPGKFDLVKPKTTAPSKKRKG